MTARSALTVGRLRELLAEHHESDIVMVEGGEFNEGVAVEKIRTVPHGMRVYLGSPGGLTVLDKSLDELEALYDSDSMDEMAGARSALVDVVGERRLADRAIRKLWEEFEEIPGWKNSWIKATSESDPSVAEYVQKVSA